MTKTLAIVFPVIAPPAICHGLSLLMPEHGLDIFSVLLIELLAFGGAVAVLRPRASGAVMAAAFYFPFMFILIFTIGYRAGYYDLP